MIYALWRLILMLLPYGVVISIHKYNKAIPANIKTVSGKVYKAVMVTEKYGLLFSSEEYVKNRVKLLRQKQEMINQLSDNIAQEMNELSFQSRDLFFEGEQTNENRGS